MAEKTFEELVAEAVQKALCDQAVGTSEPTVTETTSSSIEGKAASGGEFEELVAEAVRKALCDDGGSAAEPTVTETSSASIEGKAASGYAA